MKKPNHITLLKELYSIHKIKDDIHYFSFEDIQWMARLIKVTNPDIILNMIMKLLSLGLIRKVSDVDRFLITDNGFKALNIV